MIEKSTAYALEMEYDLGFYCILIIHAMIPKKILQFIYLKTKGNFH